MDTWTRIATAPRTYRLCPTNRLVIEWQTDPAERWGFYKVCDSPNEAKRSLAILNGESPEVPEQLDFEIA